MRSLVTIPLLCLLLLHSVSGQVQQSPRKDRGFELPSEIVLPLVVHQPDCPLQFEKALVIRMIEGGGKYLYQVRNKGSKPIVSYMIATLTSAGTGDTWGSKTYRLDEPLIPNQTTPKSMENWGIEILPLTAEMRQQYEIGKTMKGLVVFMVVRVEFSDGSLYDAHTTYKALEEFFREK
jgi:hypothetical protein